MRRTLEVGATFAVAVALAGVPGAALAGGGCHGSMTEADGTGTAEATITMVDGCFEASVLRVDPGTDVTFVNEDPLVHNVGGAEWGFYGEMQQGDIFTARFADPGVYPFACSYHPGMTGAIVVGDGKGAGAGWTVLSDPVRPAAEHAPQTVVVREPGGLSALPLVGVGLIGIVLGVGAALGVGRLRRTAAV